MPKFNLKTFLKIIIIAHLGIYATWMFISMSFTEPFIITFSNEDGRVTYILLLYGLLVGTAPIYAPIKDKDDE